MPTVSVRYIVNDVDAAIAFYCERLGFHEDMHPGPSFAMLTVAEQRQLRNLLAKIGSKSQSLSAT